MTDNAMQLRRATRQGVIPWIDLYSESGCGKTYSALLLARGIAGPTGKIVLCDTESRRGSLYADVIPGGYDVLDLDAPFTPARCIEALDIAAKSGASVVVSDSMSHFWDGIGGVCDMAAQNEENSKKPGLHNWNKPKMEHAKMVQYMLRYPVPLICCIRAKYKTRQKKDEKGKTVIVKDEATSPIQADDFIFESTCHAEILQDHSIILTKCSHPSLRSCFPTREEGPITIEHGQKLARWCAAAGASNETQQPGSAATGTAKQPEGILTPKQLREKLWHMIPAVHRGGGNWLKANDYLRKRALIGDNEDAATFTAEQLISVIDRMNDNIP